MRRGVLVDSGNSAMAHFLAAYDSEFVEALREFQTGTHWNAAEGAWVVYVDDVDQFLSVASYFYDVTDLRGKKPQTKAAPCTQRHYPAQCTRAHALEPWSTLWLAEGAPQELIHPAYRAAAKRAHPDSGGSNERMKAVNAAYESLKK